MHRPDALRRFAFRDFELVVVAIAAALQFFEIIAVVSDQAAHHAHVAGGAFELALGCLQICLGGVNILLGAAQIRGHFTDLLRALLLHGSQLRGQLLIGCDLLLLDSLCAAARLGQFCLREAYFLLSDFDVPLQVREARIGLLQLGAQYSVLIVRFAQVGLQLRLRGMAQVAQSQHRDDQHPEQHRDPSRRAGVFVMIRLLWSRYVRRNAHSPS